MQQAVSPDAALTTVTHHSRLSAPPGSVQVDEGSRAADTRPRSSRWSPSSSSPGRLELWWRVWGGTMDYLNWSSVCVTFKSCGGDGRWVVHTWVTRDSSPEACLWAGAGRGGGGGGLSLLSLKHHMENERPNQTYPIICFLSALCPSGHSISPSARWSQRCSEDGNIRSFCACVTCPKWEIFCVTKIE